ncbi:ChrR family anti-sigma-E factor [Pseudoalteromonas xiamenensis]|jgi:putative transcriptional regulator|uniref:ChrR family anti-sigma-E factor n=1 Tax=Pseudoalteromonas xiamenensis TaxID=882626 RepID=UPI0035E81786
MIKHHPTDALLFAFAEGSLSVTLSMAVSAHIELCECCQQKLTQLEQSLGEESLGGEEEILVDSAFAAMFDDITADDTFAQTVDTVAETIMYQRKEIILPRALSCIERTEFLNLGKIGRSRYTVEDGTLRASLLHIGAGGEIPNHTHTGFEVTLLLDGDFGDEDGDYVPGDFIMLDGRHTHTPKTKEGCLCFTVVSAQLHFNKGLSKLLNPIGNLIY